MPQFKKARYVKSKSAKGSYIVYYAWDVQKGKLARQRHYIPDKYKTEAEKTAYAKDAIKKINKGLKEGFHIDRQKKKEETAIQEASEKKVYSIETAIEEFLKIKKSQRLYKRGLQFYSSNLNQFLGYLKIQKKHSVWIGDLDFQTAKGYFTYLRDVKENAAKTYNNALGVLITFYNECLTQEWVEGKNPFDKIVKLPADYGTKNKAYSNDQIAKIKEYILDVQKDEYLWCIICFIYYAFLRPSEIRRLKVRDIDLEKNLIWIDEKVSKTKKRDIIPIVPALRKEIVKMKIDGYDPEHFLFTRFETPGNIKMGAKLVQGRFKKVKEHFNLHSDYTIYGFKHTAVVNWYKKEKD